MSDCWMADPKMRPSFSELADKLSETLLDGEREVSTKPGRLSISTVSEKKVYKPRLRKTTAISYKQLLYPLDLSWNPQDYFLRAGPLV